MTKYGGQRVRGSTSKLAASDSVVSISGIDGIEGERTLAAGTGVTITDGGAGSTVTIAQASSTVGAPYVTIGNDGTLTGERALTAGAGINITDGGANSTVTVSSTTASNVSFVTLGTSGELGSERVLTAGGGIDIADGGAGSTVTVSGTLAVDMSQIAFVTVQQAGAVAYDRVLTAGTGMSITDGGAGGNITVSSTLVSGISFVSVDDESASFASARQLAAGSNITLTDNGAGSTLSIASTASGGATVSRGTYASRPTASSAGNLHYATDMKVWFRDTGAAWEDCGSDWGYDWWRNNFFTQDPSAVEIAGLETIPAVSENVPATNATFAQDATHGHIKLTTGATNAASAWSWDMTASATEAFIMVQGITVQLGADSYFIVGIQDDTLGGAQIDDAYGAWSRFGASDSIQTFNESGGFNAIDTKTTLHTPQHGSNLNGHFTMGFYWKNVAGTNTTVVAVKNGDAWEHMLTSTDGTLNTNAKTFFCSILPGATNRVCFHDKVLGLRIANA